MFSYSSQQVDEIAYKMGYDSPASFTKAFKKHFGVSPTEFRNNKKWYTMKTQASNKELPKGFSLKPRIVARKIKKAIYVRLIGDYQSNDYNQAWEKISKLFGEKHLFGFNQEYLGAVYDAIYHIWLPDSNFELRNDPAFEKYVKFSKTDPEKNKTEIYIPIV